MSLYDRVLEFTIPSIPRLSSTRDSFSCAKASEAAARDYLEEGIRREIRSTSAPTTSSSSSTRWRPTRRYTSEHFEIHLKAEDDSLLVPLLHRGSGGGLRGPGSDSTDGNRRSAPSWRCFPLTTGSAPGSPGFPQVPGIPAVCFGDIIATDSPRTLAGSSNWRDILRHEFGHVLALGMTDKQVPFWFTEGLSVFLEEYPRGETLGLEPQVGLDRQPPGSPGLPHHRLHPSREPRPAHARLSRGGADRGKPRGGARMGGHPQAPPRPSAREQTFDQALEERARHRPETLLGQKGGEDDRGLMPRPFPCGRRPPGGGWTIMESPVRGRRGRSRSSSSCWF